jgi:hypothetical protein
VTAAAAAAAAGVDAADAVARAVGAPRLGCVTPSTTPVGVVTPASRPITTSI